MAFLTYFGAEIICHEKKKKIKKNFTKIFALHHELARVTDDPKSK